MTGVAMQYIEESRELVRWRRWVWRPGMVTLDGATCLAVDGDRSLWAEPEHADAAWVETLRASTLAEDSPEELAWLPDMAHAGTRAEVLEIIRTARKCRRLFLASKVIDGRAAWAVCGEYDPKPLHGWVIDGVRFDAHSEARALADAARVTG